MSTSGGHVVVYSLGARELLRPLLTGMQAGDHGAPEIGEYVADIERKGLPIGDLGSLLAGAGPALAPEGTVWLIMLDRLYQHLVEKAEPAALTFLFIQSKQPKHDHRDTAALFPLLEKWAAARPGVTLAKPVTSTHPESRDDAFGSVVPEVERRLKALEPSIITFALGPSTPALQLASLAGAFQGLWSRPGVRAVELTEDRPRRDENLVVRVAEERPFRKGLDTLVRPLDLPFLMSARSFRQELRRRVSEWELAPAAALLDVAPEGIASQRAKDVADAARSYLRRDDAAVAELRPWPVELQEAGRQAAHLVDLVEALWAENHSDWEVAHYLGLLVIKVLPAAWAEAYAARAFGMAAGWRDALAHAEGRAPTCLAAARRIAKDLNLHMEDGMQEARALLIAAGPQVVNTDAGIRRLPRARALASDCQSCVWWFMAWEATRLIRNEVAHVFGRISRDKLRAELKAAIVRADERASVFLTTSDVGSRPNGIVAALDHPDVNGLDRLVGHPGERWAGVRARRPSATGWSDLFSAWRRHDNVPVVAFGMFAEARRRNVLTSAEWETIYGLAAWDADGSGPDLETTSAADSFPSDAFDPTGPGASGLRRFVSQFVLLVDFLPNRVAEARAELLKTL